ncbi:hypothetical protein TNMX_11210 [Thermus sp. NMX2.A1]|nr:hypothetical protein TNMX_11210 [Thermus sp. NMX2.A1]
MRLGEHGAQGGKVAVAAPLHQAKLPEFQEGLLHGAGVEAQEEGEVLGRGLLPLQAGPGEEGEVDQAGDGLEALPSHLAGEGLLEDGVRDQGESRRVVQVGPSLGVSFFASHGAFWAFYPGPGARGVAQRG